ncbi:DUF605-domain-containing protein [Meira miltonrushii]|uniref:DUF605-domain-containing protein n=1 Tax=Meira miltonrushii TaxID=1280837 RepID=A0A316VIB5_9BASI|nr:DUF605-domain-containing protein [Meira miltonrushii]PWN37004.1 DUF605-domain-containing protein [Meira miltonrushii]
MASNNGAAATFVPPPDDLKALSPFLQRAHETRKADPALSYWCNYHAAQVGISKLSSLVPTSKAYLMSLMDTLESQKKSLAGNDIVHGDDLVAKAHIENVALKVFAGADNEDRSGKASRATAKRFLVASNFIELLTNFGPLETEWEEKLKYTKWKAADIAKAFREGRKPTPGPADGMDDPADTEEIPKNEDEAMLGIQAASAKMGGLTDVTAQLPTSEELDAEMAKLTSQEEDHNEPVAISPNVEPPTPDRSGNPAQGYPEGMSPSQIRSRRAESRLSFDGRTGMEGWQDAVNSSSSTASASSPNFSMPLRIARQGSQTSDDPNMPSSDIYGGVQHPSETQSAFFQYQQGRVSSGSGASSPHHRPLPHPPGSGNVRGGLPVPPGGQGTTTPLIPPTSISPAASPALQHSAAFSPFNQYNQALQPSAPPSVSHAAVTPSAPPDAPDPSTLPSSLDHKSTARVQKLAKWAVSALDYDDVETARKQLREALDICEGRIPTTK